VHVCYCYTPFRYAWYEEATRSARSRRCCARCCARSCAASAAGISPPAAASTPTSRSPSSAASGSSATTAATPPSSTRRSRPHRFAPAKPGDALLVVSEIVRHKRLHIALEAARRARAPIQVVGAGPDHGALSEAYPEAEFLGRASDEELVELYASARAVLMPSMEEFGITAVEAQAAGRPVIAAAAGGALETVLDGQTGRLARLDDVDSFVQRDRTIDELDFDPARAVQNAERFSVAAFERRLSAHVAEILEGAGRG
jgi:glycosyltransferase involved in cell wall biosynthesis